MKFPRRTFLALPFGFASAKPALLPVLIIDGINNHDWEAGTRGIRRILEATGRFSVTISTTPSATAPIAEWDQWRPDFSQYRVIINNFNGGHKADGIRWPSAVEKAFEEFVRKGGGLVNFHAANNAFLGWADYNEMIGLGWRDRSFGPELVIDENEKVKVIAAGTGLGPGHGPRHDFQMITLDLKHPITQGLPKLWMHPSEQLTHGQHAVANPQHGAPEKALHFLTYAMSKDSHRREPMDWIRQWGKGRIYTTMLGHTWRNEKNPNLRCVSFETLLARGAEWAATGKVTIPLPTQLPSPDQVRLSGDE